MYSLRGQASTACLAILPWSGQVASLVASGFDRRRLDGFEQAHHGRLDHPRQKTIEPDSEAVMPGHNDFAAIVQVSVEDGASDADRRDAALAGADAKTFGAWKRIIAEVRSHVARTNCEHVYSGPLQLQASSFAEGIESVLAGAV